MLERVWPVLGLCLLGLPAWSQTVADTVAPPAPASVVEEAEAPAQVVLVSGSRPGPGLWKVSKDEHVMWVFGTYGPLPKNMEWRAREVEKIIARSQEYLQQPRGVAAVGLIRGMTALPFLAGFKNNPGGAELKDVLPPDVYARWQPLKQKYFGNDNGVERQRPSFAAAELYSRALEAAGLHSGDVEKTIGKLAEKHKIKVTDPRYSVEVKNPGKALREFKKSPMADAPCLAQTMASLDTDVDVMRARANAWAIGELDEIRKVNFSERSACYEAFNNSSIARNQPELQARKLQADAKWVAAAEKALATNASTFTVVPIKDILDPKGVIATLQGKGYTVEAPQ